MKVRELIENEMLKQRLNQRDLAALTGISYQELNMFLTGKRSIPTRKAIIIDKVLMLPAGYIARSQLEEEIQKEMKHINEDNRKQQLIAKIKENGGFWSYSSTPNDLDDESVIEAALIHLPFEEMPLLKSCWSKSTIKKVWKERLLTQGKRMNILNFLLAVKVFRIKEPLNYLQKWAS